jgi:hypothetical protein
MAVGGSFIGTLADFPHPGSLMTRTSFTQKAPFHRYGTGLFIFTLLFLLPNCSSLDQSQYDQNFRMQGTYSCEKFSHESPALRESLAEADTSRVRCARDEWKILKDRVVFTRSFFQSKECDGILGRVTFSEPLEQKGDHLEVKKVNCHVIRKNPSWLAENSGQCMLNHLKLDTPYDPGVLRNCKTYVPKFCDTGETIEIDPAEQVSGRSPYTLLKFDPAAGQASNCTRYTH